MLRTGAALLALSLAASSAVAQIAHANFDTLVFDNSQSMSHNLLVAIQTQMPVAATATRIEFWTGEQTGTSTVAIWSHDAVNNQPLALLGSGSWAMNRVNGWQGAPLSAPLPLTAGQDIWVVWGPVGGAQSSVQAMGPGGQPYRASTNGGTTWGNLYQGLQWKFRIWAGNAGHYTQYGTGCLGSTRYRPELGWFGLPRVGTSFLIHLDRALPGTFAVLSFGDSDTTNAGISLPYSLAGQGAPGCSVLASLAATTLYPTDPATGQTVVTINLPAAPFLVGFRFYNQWFCLDAPANPLGLTVSNGGAGTIGS